MRKIAFLTLFLSSPLMALTVTTNGNYLEDDCSQGRMSVEANYDGADTGTVTLQYEDNSGTWKNACSTTSDCQWTSGDSGKVPFDFGAAGNFRLNVADLSSETVYIDLVCDNAR